MKLSLLFSLCVDTNIKNQHCEKLTNFLRNSKLMYIFAHLIGVIYLTNHQNENFVFVKMNFFFEFASVRKN